MPIFVPDEIVTAAKLNSALHTKVFRRNASTTNEDAPTTGFAVWPGNNTESIGVPAWAVRAVVTVILTRCSAVTAVLNHDWRIVFGSQNSGPFERIVWNPTQVPQGGHQVIIGAHEFTCTTEAGSTITVESQANRVSGTGALRVENTSQQYVIVDFYGEA